MNMIFNLKANENIKNTVVDEVTQNSNNAIYDILKTIPPHMETLSTFNDSTMQTKYIETHIKPLIAKLESLFSKSDIFKNHIYIMNVLKIMLAESFTIYLKPLYIHLNTHITLILQLIQRVSDEEYNRRQECPINFSDDIYSKINQQINENAQCVFNILFVVMDTKNFDQNINKLIKGEYDTDQLAENIIMKHLKNQFGFSDNILTELHNSIYNNETLGQFKTKCIKSFDERNQSLQQRIETEQKEYMAKHSHVPINQLPPQRPETLNEWFKDAPTDLLKNELDGISNILNNLVPKFNRLYLSYMLINNNYQWHIGVNHTECKKLNEQIARLFIEYNGVNIRDSKYTQLYKASQPIELATLKQLCNEILIHGNSDQGNFTTDIDFIMLLAPMIGYIHDDRPLKDILNIIKNPIILHSLLKAEKYDRIDITPATTKELNRTSKSSNKAAIMIGATLLASGIAFLHNAMNTTNEIPLDSDNENTQKQLPEQLISAA